MGLLSFSSTSSRQPRHDVFLSFRGEDTRDNFLCFLYQALRAKGIEPYLDSKELPKGEEISWALLKAIEESKISAIVFSENYATSSWCLEEVSHIMQCWHLREQLVVPIFYHVNPSDIRKQTGRYEKAFIEHERNRTEMDKVQRWRNALVEAGTLSGWHLAGDKPDELKVIEEIVQDIINKLSSRNAQSDNKGLVGIGPKLEQIKSLLCIGEKGVRMIGIWGMGGIGKTTLGRAIYEEVSGQFESSCLILNVRHQMSEEYGAITLRNELLSTLLNEENYCLHVVTPRTGSMFIKNRLRSKRVLVVLDDVSDFEQFEKLEISHDHFGSGSRIIVTSRDKQVLANAPVDEVYEVEELNYDDSVKLFSLYAFKQNHLIDGFRDLSAKVLEYARGLPIALKVLGSALHKRSKKYWKSTLNKLKEHPDQKIFDLLKTSFDGLDDIEKNIFLDMACFLKWYIDRERATRILDNCYDGMACWALSNLVDKCLLTGDDNMLSMHDLLQEMGREIVCKESDDPGKRSRLWASKDVCRVLESNMGTESIKGISLNISQIKTPLQIYPSTFEKMVNVLFLHFQHERYDMESRNKLLLANQELTYLPDSLRYFYWEDCPLRYLPSNFSPNNLVELWLPNSKIEQLWNEDQDVVNLRVMFLYGCKDLCKIPNLLGATKLEILWCHGCERLAGLPSMTHLTSLKTLNLNHCPITKFPEIPTNGALEELSLAGTQIEEVPSFIGCLKNLQRINMSRTKIRNIPSSIVKLNALQDINLSECPNLTELNLNIEEVTSSISGLQNILTTTLDVANCKNLKSVSKVPRGLQMYAYGGTSLERVSFIDLEDHYDQHVFALSCQHEFHNCFNLSQDARNNIVTVYPWIRSHYMAKESAKCLAENKWDELPDSLFKRSHVLLYLPGSTIPDKFENQTRNSSITVKLGSATSTRFLCFALCLVLHIKHRQYSKLLSIHCEYQLKGIDGGQNSKRWVHKWQQPIRVGCSSEYLFLLFNENMVHRDRHYKEASFDFHVVAEQYSTDGEVGDYRKVIKVEKCGVHVFYVDAESFTVTDVGSSIINGCSDENNSPNIISPKSRVRSSTIEDDSNVENGHPASTVSRPDPKRSISSDYLGDHEADKRLKLF